MPAGSVVETKPAHLKQPDFKLLCAFDLTCVESGNNGATSALCSPAAPDMN